MKVAVTYVILVGSFWLYIAIVVNRWPASAASYQTVLMPLVAVALSAWLEGEALTIGLLLGGDVYTSLDGADSTREQAML